MTHQLINYRQNGADLLRQPGRARSGSTSSRLRTPTGSAVATVSSGTQMRQGLARHTFVWHGRLNHGRRAPDGIYYFRIVLVNQGRSFALSSMPVRVITSPPDPRVTERHGAQQPNRHHHHDGHQRRGATTTSTATSTATATSTTTSTAPTTASSGAPASPTRPAVISAPHTNVRIRYTPRPVPPRLDQHLPHRRRRQAAAASARFAASATATGSALWNGEIDDEPAPAGTYLVGITAQNLACDQASWPVVMPPAPGTTPGAGVTVRYLSVTPPLTPTAPGSRARRHRRLGRLRPSCSCVAPATSKVLAHGSGRRRRSTSQRADAATRGRPLRARPSAPGRRARRCRWSRPRQAGGRARARAGGAADARPGWATSPVDDTGDGLPDTLRPAPRSQLNRPLVDGPPASLARRRRAARVSDATQHCDLQLTTDVALAEGVGPSLVDRWGVLFPDGDDFLPATLASDAAAASSGAADAC